MTPVESKIYVLGFANIYILNHSKKEDIYIVFSIFADKYKVYNVHMVRRYLTNSHINPLIYEYPKDLRVFTRR